MAAALDAHLIYKEAYYVQLVIARENELFLTGFVVLRRLNKAVEDVKNAIPLQNLTPEIGGAITALNRRVARALIKATVKRDEGSVLAVQLRCHPDFISIHCKVNQRPLAKLEQWFIRRAVILILRDSVLEGLTRQRVFKLHRDDGQTVQEYHRVNGVFIGEAVFDLAGHLQNVFIILRHSGLVHPAAGLKVAQANGYTEVNNTMP